MPWNAFGIGLYKEMFKADREGTPKRAKPRLSWLIFRAGLFRCPLGKAIGHYIRERSRRRKALARPSPGVTIAVLFNRNEPLELSLMSPEGSVTLLVQALFRRAIRQRPNSFGSGTFNG